MSWRRHWGVRININHTSILHTKPKCCKSQQNENLLNTNLRNSTLKHKVLSAAELRECWQNESGILKEAPDMKRSFHTSLE